MRIAITGGIGSGKSTLGNIFKDFGYPVFSCDEIYSDVINGEEYILSIKNIFGNAVITDGRVDRKKLSALVFEDEEKLKRLNSVSHPLIMKKLLHLTDKYSIAFAEVPLLFEGGYERLFDKVIIVYRDVLSRVKSVVRRDGLTEDDVKKRIENQLNYESLSANGYTIIYNDGDIEMLKREAEQFINELKK